MSSAFERLQKIAKEKKEQEKPKLEIVSRDNQPNQPNQDNQPKKPNVPNQPKTNKSVAPEKDFTKVPNSITRNAIPERLFKGMSKNTYDALYLKTRGAINPIRKIRATKSDLIRWTGVSDVTLDKHLKYLRSVGLVDWQLIIGSHDGNWYEVFVPEELDLTNLTNLTNLTIDNQPKKVGGQVPNFLGGVGGVQFIENTDGYEFPKTSLKTNTTDDDLAFAGFTAKIEAVSRKLTGKGFTKKDVEKWNSLADLLVLELEAAASRTEGIFICAGIFDRNSAPPVFLIKTVSGKPAENSF